jgi:hypothetical protein
MLNPSPLPPAGPRRAPSGLNPEAGAAHPSGEHGKGMDAADAPAAPLTVGGKSIEVQWRTARAYSYEADENPDGPSLTRHPKGMKPRHKPEERPRRIESVAREMGGCHADEAGEGVLRRKDELKHYLAEFGPAAVQNRLSVLPSLSRRPSDGELHVMRDFAQAVLQSTRLSRGRKGPRQGEFIATYSRKADKDTGETKIKRANFAFNPAHSIEVPGAGGPHDYVIHSHPYDPNAPLAAAWHEPLGGAYPSGQDRFMACKVGHGGQPPPKELMMHGGQVFHIHRDDLHFSLLDPAAGETLHLADRTKGPGWDDALYANPEGVPFPPAPGSAPVP